MSTEFQIPSDNVDAMKNLEREIAEMHSNEYFPPAAQVTEAVRDDDICDKQDNANDSIKSLQSVCTKNSPEMALETYDHDDLIAVLKGDVAVEDEQFSRAASTHSEPMEKVIIEGEGQYQVIDVFDDDVLDCEQVQQGSDSIQQPMTSDEIRAVAMEQIENLKRSSKQNAQRRRKQDIKPKPVEYSDLISSLGADWSDDESPADSIVSNEVGDSNGQCSKKDELKNADMISPVSKTVMSMPTNDKSNNSSKKYTVDMAANSSNTGFKRTRVIKRKIIWDPDAPETQISYAQLIRGNSLKQQSVDRIKPKEPEITDTKDNVIEKRSRSSTPKDNKRKECVRVSNPSKLKSLENNSNATQVQTESSPEYTSTHTKRRSQTPVNASSVGSTSTSSKKKKITEIDKLMGDEGAANMLTSLENELGRLGNNSDHNKPHRPLMRSRALTISERATKRETIKSTTRKALEEGSIVTVTKSKRGTKPKASSSWDYVYKQQANDDAMIIRRRSNSSYSSAASLNRLSIDGPSSLKASSENTLNTDFDSNLLKTISKKGNSSFEFIRPESKSTQKTHRRTKSPEQSLSVDLKKTHTLTLSSNAKRSVDKNGDKDVCNTEVLCKKTGKVGQIIFNTNKAKVSYSFTVQLLNKLSDALDKLCKDADCNCVVLLSNSPHSCQGIDYTEITVSSTEKRKSAATEMVNALKRYLKTLAYYTKPLITGVCGANMGFGVTQLLFFDIVVGSDKGSYETNYAKFGLVPEGYCIWNCSTKIRPTFKTKLFWLCEKLTATESTLSGLVYKLSSCNKVNDEALNLAKFFANLPNETFGFIKKVNSEMQFNKIVQLLDKEFDLVLEYWCSLDYYEKLKNFMDNKKL